MWPVWVHGALESSQNLLWSPSKDSVPRTAKDPLCGRPMPICTFVPLAPYFNFVSYPEYGSTILAAIQNTKVILASSHSLKVIHTSNLTQGRSPKGNLFFCWILPTARALPASCHHPCPGLPSGTESEVIATMKMMVINTAASIS